MEDLRVLAVSGDPLARTGLALLLRDQEGVTVSGRGSGGRRLASSRRGRGARRGGLGPRSESPLRLGRATLPRPHRSAHRRHRSRRDGRAEALAAGARGALSRNADGDRLAAALRAVVLGLVVLDETFAEDALRSVPAIRARSAERRTRASSRSCSSSGRAAQHADRPPARHQRALRGVSRQRRPRQAGRAEPQRGSCRRCGRGS